MALRELLGADNMGQRLQAGHDFAHLPAQPLASFHNIAASSWYNITAWAINVTRNTPLLEDILLAGPRIFMRIGSYMAHTDEVDSSGPALSSRSLPAGAFESSLHHLLESNYDEPIKTSAGKATGYTDPTMQAAQLSLDGARGLGSVFGYATSKWALSCIAMAIILNRTYIFAATRRRLRLHWHIRLLLRLIPITVLALQCIQLLRSIQCQTSTEFSQLRWRDDSKHSNLSFAHPNVFFNKLSSILLLGATDSQSCQAVNMIPNDEGTKHQHLQGSLSLLWPLFGTLCLSHFIETLSCAVQGRPLSAETGMTLFEQSLAFAEADAAINNQLGFGIFSSNQQGLNAKVAGVAASVSMTRSAILSKVNTPSEVLFIAFLSSMTHISSHILGVFDAQAKYRLASTGIWGMTFMATIVWSTWEFELGNPSAQSLLRFPTVCIIGFVPHVLVLAGITTCSLIYGLALVLSALAPPFTADTASMNFRQRLARAHGNMQANVSLSEIRITREMDFYTALLRTGFAAITMASEAVYLNEDRRINIQRQTWLEEERLREVEEFCRQSVGTALPNPQYDQSGVIGLVPVKEGTLSASSGYGRERAAQRISKGRSDRSLRAGTGATERSSRWLMAVELLLSISKLIARISALAILLMLSSMRIRTPPAWLLSLARHRDKSRPGESISPKTGDTDMNYGRFSFLGEDMVSPMDGIDVEEEFRRMNARQNEEALDADLYDYWLAGGWWGSSDGSGDYEPTDVDEWDATSATSLSTAACEEDISEFSWESESAGHKTPTEFSPPFSRDNTPPADSILDTDYLARLLHPVTSEERHEAQNLSAHLQSHAIMTRSSFRRQERQQRRRVLLRPDFINVNFGGVETSGMRPSQHDEEHILEQILLSHRSQKSIHHTNDLTNHEHGSHSTGEESLPCVVCQSSVRTIIVWPCRCLSLCDDCRVSLAMNNFDKCVCCRRDVMSFSRIFIP